MRSGQGAGSRRAVVILLGEEISLVQASEQAR
jgi:hypothetical protein